jgi:hypothetical protein
MRGREWIMVRVGDWVKVRLSEYDVIGYVVWIFDYSVEIQKTICVRNGEIEPIEKRLGTYSLYEINLIPDMIHPEDLKELIDMALDQHDRQWFEELMKKKNRTLTKLYKQTRQ